MYIRNHSEKNMSDSDFTAPLYASYSVRYYMTNTSVSQMKTTCIVLPVDTLEGNWVEKKRQHSPSNTNLSIPYGERASLMLFPWVGNLPVFSCNPEFLKLKCAEFSSKLNSAIGRFLWWILKKLEPYKCPKVQKYQKIHFEAERVK